MEFKNDVEQVEAPHRLSISEKDMKGDVDAAVKTVQNQDLNFTPEENRLVLRKIDWHLLPIMAFACGIQLVDKSGLGAAATYGMRQDLGLVGQQYSWCVSIFYFGYMGGSFISGRGLQYFHSGKYIGINYFIWGCTLVGCTGAKNYVTILVLRFLLGVCESCLVPGLLLITTMWFTHREQPFRFGLWNVLNGVLPIPFLVIYYALGKVTGGPLEPWRLIFLLIGLISCMMGVIIWLFLPDSPMSASWLSEREKAIAIARVAEGQTGVKNTHFKWSQVREASTDFRVWLIVLTMLFSQAAGSVTTNFIGIIINGFGFDPLRTQLFTAPNFAAQAVTQMLVSIPPSFIYRFRNQKIPLTMLATVAALTGTIILYLTPAEMQYQYRRLGGVIIISCSGVNQTVIMSIIGANIGGFTKKQITASATFFCYCIINIITPQTFLGRESPEYHTGLTFVMICLSISLVLFFLSYIAMNIENKRRDSKALTDPAYATGDENTDLMSGLRDETDIQNKHHRYSS